MIFATHSNTVNMNVNSGFAVNKQGKRRKKYCPVERFNYLKQLTHEFNVTSSPSAKEEIIANLANFAYDPINYHHFRKLGIISTFLQLLDGDNFKLIQFAIKGLCNLAPDEDNRKVICLLDGLPKIEECIFKDDIDIVLNSLGVLFMLDAKISRADVKLKIELLVKHSDKRIANIATILTENW